MVLNVLAVSSPRLSGWLLCRVTLAAKSGVCEQRKVVGVKVYCELYGLVKRILEKLRSFAAVVVLGCIEDP